MPAPFSDPSLQTYTINDFTPGIQRWSMPGVPGNYPPFSPPGSASHAYRCWARPGIGLLPFPTYQLAQQYVQAADPANPLCVSLGNMLSLAPRGGALADIVSTILVQHGTGTAINTDFHITRLPVNLSTLSPTTVYNSGTTGQFPINTFTWPMMDYGVFQDPTSSRYSRVVLTTDPVSTSQATTAGPGIWVTVRGWTTPATGAVPDVTSGNFTLIGAIGSYPRIFYHASRMGIWQADATVTTDGFVATDTDELFVSNGAGPVPGFPPFNPNVIANAGTFFAEMGASVGTWGSWSTGELCCVYQDGGAFILYGDILSPTSSYKLSGVVGTSGVAGRAALTPVGMIYPRYNEGVYLWNGDNVSQSISRQIPGGVFVRSVQSQGFAASPPTMSTAVWGEWVMFPNNWMYDTALQSWWLCENPDTLNFQVHASVNSGSFLSSPGIAYSAVNTPCALNTYYWTRTSAATSYFWQSNPMSVTVGALVTIATIEIVASNLTPTPARIVIQPISPTEPYLTQPFGNNQNNNTITFDIPANTSNYRAQKRVGYTDYNIQLAVTAMNTGTNAAPTLHAINCSYAQTRTSGVQ